MVGSGKELLYSKVCLTFPISLQGHLFAEDLHILGLKGADVVLGAHWLNFFWYDLMDYQSLTKKVFP